MRASHFKARLEKSFYKWLQVCACLLRREKEIPNISVKVAFRDYYNAVDGESRRESHNKRFPKAKASVIPRTQETDS